MTVLPDTTQRTKLPLFLLLTITFNYLTKLFPPSIYSHIHKIGYTLRSKDRGPIQNSRGRETY